MHDKSLSHAKTRRREVKDKLRVFASSRETFCNSLFVSNGFNNSEIDCASRWPPRCEERDYRDYRKRDDHQRNRESKRDCVCLLYTSDAADERSSVDLG